MKLIQFLFKYYIRYFRYFRRAKTRFDVHSPFVSQFVEQTLEDRRWYYIFDYIETLREKLALNDDELTVIDFGAGSQLGLKKTTTVKKIARYSAITPPAGQLLFRIINFLQPGKILELGTSLGVSAIYQMAAKRNAKMLTIEGNPPVAELAVKNIHEAGFKEVEVISGSFKEVLPNILKTHPAIDFFHFDGDHRYEPTLNYFEQCLPISHDQSVFCIGDIYWSAEMEKAWNELKGHPRVRLSIDVFHFGLLFLRKEQKEKEHFTLIASRMKPWRMGFF